MSNWIDKAIKIKLPLSKAETAREAYSWFYSKWKRDYPDLYRDRYKMPSWRQMNRRRPRRPIYSRRRRLTAVTPARKRTRASMARATGRVYGRSGGKAFKFGRSNIGQRPGEGTTKTRVVNLLENVNRGTDILYPVDMCDIPLGQALDERERYMVNLRGFKIQMYFRQIIGFPTVCNFAIVAGRSKNIISSTDFFRDYGGTRDTAVGSGSGCVKALRDINTDEYVVLKHSRFVLAEPGATSTWKTDARNSCWKLKEFYLPLKRQLRYADSAGTSCNEKVFFVYWFTNLEDTTAATSVPDYCQITHRMIAYYYEPKN